MHAHTFERRYDGNTYRARTYLHTHRHALHDTIERKKWMIGTLHLVPIYYNVASWCAKRNNSGKDSAHMGTWMNIVFEINLYQQQKNLNRVNCMQCKLRIKTKNSIRSSNLFGVSECVYMLILFRQYTFMCTVFIVKKNSQFLSNFGSAWLNSNWFFCCSCLGKSICRVLDWI